MSWHLSALVDATPQAWRNGGGTTRELAAAPAGADWRWRVSVAEVERSGPFSVFDGVDRSFAVLSGAGVVLDVDGVPHRLTAASPPLAFDGGAAVHCRLIDGPTRDFNLMVRRRAGQGFGQRFGQQREAGLHRVEGPGEHLVPIQPGTTVAVYAVDSAAILRLGGHTLTLPPHTLASRKILVPGVLQLTTSLALWMEMPS